MPAYSRRHEEHHYFHPYQWYEKEDAVNHGSPHQQQGDDFGPQRDGLVLTEIPDIGTEVFVVQQPLVQTGRTSEIEGRREQQKRSGRQQGQEYADDAECERDCSEDDADGFHAANVEKIMIQIICMRIK